MVLMTLDHCRDFLGSTFFSATDLTQTSIPLFFTRWITHLCAPTFFLLAGVSVWFQISKLGSQHIRSYLITRGTILILMELTVVHLAWYFHLDMRYAVAGVIWACGWSLVLMAAMIKLPKFFLLAVAFTIIVFQPFISNLLPYNLVGHILIRTEDTEWLSGFHFYTSYPILPWLAIVCLGYGVGSIFQLPIEKRNRNLRLIGLTFLFLFVTLRLFSRGDPMPWKKFDLIWKSLFSFINLQKYPPSLDFCLVTLGVTFILISYIERAWKWLKDVLLILGRTPLMYYVLHVFLLHVIAIGYAWSFFGTISFLTTGPQIFWDVPLQGHPPNYGLPLIGVYLTSAIVVGALLPFLIWYSNYKRKHPNSFWKFI